jgi:acetate kinase
MSSEPTPFRILVLNAGSSTLKHASFEGIESVGQGTIECKEHEIPSAITSLLKGRQWDAIAFRVVHGGSHLIAPTLITDEVLKKLEQTIPLAPLHQPPAIAAIRTVGDLHPHVPRIACFDTAFHATLPECEKRFAIPERYYGKGIRRYGFHGLSYESIASQLSSISQRAAAGKTVVCHLGNGASLCGLENGISRYTTMGFTPIDGLIMGTRCGRLDVGVAIHWLRNGMEVRTLETMLSKESGLHGLSGGISDMRSLIAKAPQDPRCALALDMFCGTVAKEIAAAATALGGLDGIVFTAGIGENSSVVRQRVIERLAWLGASLDDDANSENELAIHSKSSSVEIFRIPTDEQRVIASHTVDFLRQSHGESYHDA